MTMHVCNLYISKICCCFTQLQIVSPTSNMASRYARAVTVFSLNRHVLHVRYAQEAVREGSTAVIVNGSDVIVLSVQKKSVVKLQAHSSLYPQ